MTPATARSSTTPPRAAATLAATALIVGLFPAPMRPALAADGPVGPQTIYGEDNRREVFGLTGRKAVSADSTVALVDAGGLASNGDGTVRLAGGTLGENYNLCPGQRFARQPTGAGCSGSLVAPDVVLTAGHCVDPSRLDTTRFVFGFRMRSSTQVNDAIPNGEVYRGRRILARQPGEGGPDYALVQLNRTVAGHEPLPVRRSGRPADGTPLYVIGHPSGLPAKFAAGAKVRDSDGDNLYANTDTFGGNSGSPVFNANNDEIVGVLVFGAADYEARGDCNVPVVLPNGDGREGITRTSTFAPFIPQR